MTTTVHVYASYVHGGSKLAVLQRDIATGNERIVNPDLAANTVLQSVCYDGTEIVLREVKPETVVLPVESAE